MTSTKNFFDYFTEKPKHLCWWENRSYGNCGGHVP